MGLFDWLKGGRTAPAPAKAVQRAAPAKKTRSGPKQDSRPNVKITVTVTPGEVADLVQVAGTTTNSKEAAATLVSRHQLADRTALHLNGSAQRKPGNTVDPNAVALIVEGERIGYLPGYVAKSLPVGVGSSIAVPVQLF